MSCIIDVSSASSHFWQTTGGMTGITEELTRKDLSQNRQIETSVMLTCDLESPADNWLISLPSRHGTCDLVGYVKLD